MRGNDLLGYGLVVGLNNTGDSLRNSPFTEDAIVNLLERLGVNVTGEQIRARNVAAVLVTAALPPFARAGSQVDVTVSAIGDAKSLLGGTLVMTPLNAADGQIYAVAQGSIIAGGIVAEGEAETVTQGVPTAGLIPSGARVEREVAFDFTQVRDMRLALRNPDFTTAARIEAAINRDVGARIARMLDSGTVAARPRRRRRRRAGAADGADREHRGRDLDQGAGGGRPAVGHDHPRLGRADQPGGGDPGQPDAAGRGGAAGGAAQPLRRRPDGGDPAHRRHRSRRIRGPASPSSTTRCRCRRWWPG